MRQKPQGISLQIYLVALLLAVFSPLSIAYTSPPKQSLNISGPTGPLTPQAARSLGWVVSNDTSEICGGYYLEPIINPYFLPGKLARISPVSIQTEHGEFSQTGNSILQGHVSITQGDRQLQANEIRLYRNKEGVVDEAELFKKVILREPGKLFVGDWARINLPNQTGALDHVYYRIAFANGKTAAPILAKPEEIKLAAGDVKAKNKDASNPVMVRLQGLNAWGYAEKIRMPDQNLINLTDTSYSTCSPTDPTWQLKAQKIHLDREKGQGSATHVRITLDQVPILYLPYFNFPIDNRRASGLLFPNIGYTTNSGFDIATPYYFNLAPNYDLLFTPRWLSERGTLLNGKARFLTATSEGELQASILPDDRKFEMFIKHAPDEFPDVDKAPLLTRLQSDSNNRRFFNFKDKTRINDHWRFEGLYKYVSDDYYFQDLGNNLIDANTNQLERSATLMYEDRYFDFIGRLQSHQTLHPINQAPINELYARMPQLFLTANFPQRSGLTYHWIGEFVNFQIKHNPGQMTSPVAGERLFIQGGVSYPRYFAGAYITPSIYLQGTGYALRHTDGASNNPARVVPILNLDTGLQFSRRLQIFETAYNQTFEPRIFYLFVPFVDQRNFPVFDTTLQPFNFEHLFRINRFDGFDRMNDANQITLALTTRFLNEWTGDEKLRASLGQIYYLRRRNVQLCITAGCDDEDNPPLTAVTSTKDAMSPLVGELNYHLSDKWWLRSGIAWSVTNNEINNGNMYLQYRPDENYLVNLGYVFVRNGDEISLDTSKNNLSQSDISFAWPLTERLSALGRWNYNLSHRYLHTYLAGVQYDSCCSAVRLVASRTFKSLNDENRPQYDKVFYIQWLLKGLGSLGTGNPGSLLTEGVVGYHDPFRL